MKALRYIVPLVIFAILVGFFLVPLKRGSEGTYDPRDIPSPLVDKPAPLFKLAQLKEGDRAFTPQEMRGKVWLMNVWASWCVSCRVEHPLLVDMSRKQLVPIVGLDYKDKREDGLKWLATHGDPYLLSAYDDEGKVGIDYGVYGVPETFVIDKEGVIRYKQIGPITPEALDKTIMPLVRKLNG